jgi:hypothetical protein
MIGSFNRVVPTLIAIAVATPALSQTKEADQKYCNALVEAYQKSEGGHGMQGRAPRSLEITKAMDGCKSGDTANAIPTLEKYLHDKKVALPAR